MDATEAISACLSGNGPRYRDLCVEWLSALVRCRSVSGKEAEAVEATASILDRIGVEFERVRMPADIRDDEYYTAPDSAPPDPWEDKDNLLAHAPALGVVAERSLIVCSHLDVVGVAEENADLFAPCVDGDCLRGRGAADAKGSAVSMLLALQALKDAGVRLRGSADLHLVVEEEIGGNGALAMVRERPPADGVVVCEPTSLHVHPANRGALWFKLITTGVSTHMGRAHEGVNAIEKAMEAIRLFRAYEARLLDESRTHPLFTRYEYPIQLNVGAIQGGVMPSMVPDAAVVEGGIGFLPGKTLNDIEQELHAAIQNGSDDWLKSHYELQFTRLRNEAYEIPPEHPLTQALAACCKAAGAPSEVFGWNVSCDARLYANVGGMPTVVFGPGDVKQAHSAGESVAIPEVVKAAEILARFMVSWCGAEMT